MRDYIELSVKIEPCSEIDTDLLAQFLADVGYETFVPEAGGLKAYIPAMDFDRQKVAEAVEFLPGEERDYTISHKVIPGQDWNTEWEKHYFQPIVVGQEVVIHSSFHTDVPKARYDIVIDPKMAFGTGHHATTSLMLSGLLSTPIKGKKVLDMGTGTGILSIMAAMLGASQVTGIEIDPDAAENARENIKLNNTVAVNILTGDVSSLKEVSDIDLFLANINRNVITADLPEYVRVLSPGGMMMLSGFYEQDIPMVMEVATPLGLKLAGQNVMDRWAMIKLKKG